MKYIFFIMLCCGLSACQQTPTSPQTTQPTTNTVPTPEGVTITPYAVDEIKRQKL